MKLLEVVRQIIEQEEFSDKVIEFPNQNFTVSVFPSDRKLLFAPEFHDSITKSMRSYITMLNQNFRIQQINGLEDEEDPRDVGDDRMKGSFEVMVDPREDFSAVVAFLQNLVDQEIR